MEPSLLVILKTFWRWLFVYLPKRFTVPFLLWLTWYLFYVWPWALGVIFPTAGMPASDSRIWIRDRLRGWLVPWWVDRLNLTPAVKAAAVLALLGLGILTAYNLAAIFYQRNRKWNNEKLFFAGVLVTIVIYAFPWIFAPKDWGDVSVSRAPFSYVLDYVFNWSQRKNRYGVLLALPLLVLLPTIGVWLADRLLGRKRKEAGASYSRTTFHPVQNDSFDQLLKKNPRLKIGLILAGGGAKGVYQAGAMRAIHEFLKGHQALGHVRMIAGTSIGSWNTLFWLAGLVDADPDEPSVHERWWYSTDIRRITQFHTYIPLSQNYLLTTQPWCENFDELFRYRELAPYVGGNRALAEALAKQIASKLAELGIGDVGSPPMSKSEPEPRAATQNGRLMHFYLTRSNVARGRLEFSTNWEQEQRDRALESDEIQLDSFTEVKSLEALRDAVFASMDLPPLFPYRRIGCNLFEDGGVIDNLPIRFGTFIEECDLLFVLALNASFEAAPDQHSMFRRLLRVLDVRQGVLERNSMRMAYLYNSLTYLASHLAVRELLKANTALSAHSMRGIKAVEHAGNATEAREPVRIFSICPEQPLAVGTTQFWKTDQFKCAFRLMYDATRIELGKFNFESVPNGLSDDKHDWMRMALVSPAGEITYNYRF